MAVAGVILPILPTTPMLLVAVCLVVAVWEIRKGLLVKDIDLPEQPLMIGGGQENGKRAGTQNVASIVALGKACEVAGENLEHENTDVLALRDELDRAGTPLRSLAHVTGGVPNQ